MVEDGVVDDIVRTKSEATSDAKATTAAVGNK
jgi:hypothetical protein